MYMISKNKISYLDRWNFKMKSSADTGFLRGGSA